MRTLRSRTTALVVLVTGLTLAAGGWALVLTLQARITATNDRVDQARLRELVAAARAGDLAPTITDVGDEGVAQVVDSRGRVLARSANIPDAGRIGAAAPGPRPTVATVDAPDDDETERYRLWAVSAPTPDGPVTAYVGTSEESVHEASRTLTRALLLGVPLVTALLGLATWLILGRALRRVDAIRSEVDSITEAELHRRVPTSPVDDEVGRLATTMNRMLARLEASSARQRDFVADASHDLQGPLAAQRAQLEVALASSGDVDVPALARDLLAGTSDMERLVRDLLFLATGRRRRSPAGARPPRPGRPPARGGRPAASGDRRTPRGGGGLRRAGARRRRRAAPAGAQPARERRPLRRDHGAGHRRGGRRPRPRRGRGRRPGRAGRRTPS